MWHALRHGDTGYPAVEPQQPETLLHQRISIPGSFSPETFTPTSFCLTDFTPPTAPKHHISTTQTPPPLHPSNSPYHTAPMIWHAPSSHKVVQTDDVYRDRPVWASEKAKSVQRSVRKKMWQVFLLTTLRYNRNWGFHNLCISGRVRPKMKGADNERSGLVKNQKGTLHETLHSIHCWVKWHKGPQENRDQLTAAACNSVCPVSVRPLVLVDTTLN